MHTVWDIRVWGVLVVTSGCFDPIDVVGLRCSDELSCPEPLVCDQARCRVPRSEARDGGGDAGLGQLGCAEHRTARFCSDLDVATLGFVDWDFAVSPTTVPGTLTITNGEFVSPPSSLAISTGQVVGPGSRARLTKSLEGSPREALAVGVDLKLRSTGTISAEVFQVTHGSRAGVGVVVSDGGTLLLTSWSRAADGGKLFINQPVPWPDTWTHLQVEAHADGGVIAVSLGAMRTELPSKVVPSDPFQCAVGFSQLDGVGKLDEFFDNVFIEVH